MKGADIKRLRDRLKLNQAEFAEFLGVSRRTLENWEQDRNTPRGSALSLLTLADSGALAKAKRKR